MTRLLVVEDDESLGETLKLKLEREGCSVSLVATLADARQLFRGDDIPFDCCILDVGLPDGSGLDLARDLRATSSVPIIMLSAMSSAEYRLEGFEIGADDYVPKPFHFKELFLRIQRLLERKQALMKSTYDAFQLDEIAMAIIDRNTGEKSFLTELDFKVFIYLIRHSPRAISREELLQKNWVQGERETNRTVDNAIVRIRQALGTASECVRSVRGVGYQFVG